MTKNEAIELVNSWAEEAENGNYHDLATILYYLSDTCSFSPGRYVIIKSVDENPIANNIVELEINE